MKTIDPCTLKNLVENGQVEIENIIDVRSKMERLITKIKGSRHLSQIALSSNPQDFLDKKTRYYIVCASSQRSGQVVAILSKQGYDVVNVSGGVSSYNGC